MPLSPRETEILLDTLCQGLGFCLPLVDRARIRDSPPSNAKSFADEVFRAEGLDPVTADSDLYREVLAEVKRAFAGTH
jgi:hypothetical protein